jgi:betaine lipid synthase
MPELDLGPAVLPTPIDKEVAIKTAVPLPWSSFHYCARQWRVPFLEKKEHGEFRTWIYGFTVRDFVFRWY